MFPVKRPRIPIKCQWLQNLHRHKVLGRVIPGTSAIQSHSFSQLQTLYPDDHEFFRYTSGRWLRNDITERRDRYVRFDVNALCETAARSCGVEKCTAIKKLDEGSFNRVFLLRLDNDMEVVARIPFPRAVAGPPHFLTASEVATLDFIRNVMSIPAPKVLAWSSRAESTSVGSEFMILEKVDGLQFAHITPEIQNLKEELDGVKQVLRQVLDIDLAFSRLHFAMHGSLFYKKDVVEYPHSTRIFADENLENELTRKFAIGPSMSWHLWSDERKHMDIDRGPWKSTDEYMTSLLRCQQEWLRRYAKPRRPEDPTYRSAKNNDPQNHIEALEKCLEAMPHIIPSELAWPTIWHPDLHKANLFVTKGNPHMLSGIIDWQSTHIGPFFCQMRVPMAFLYHGSRIKPDEINATLPDNFNDLTDVERKLILEEKFDACVEAMYKAMTKFNPNLHALLNHQEFPIVMKPFTSALDSWDRGLEELQFYLLILSVNWEVLADEGSESPMQYNDEDKSRILLEFRRHVNYQRNFASLCEKIGCDGYNRVRNEDYDRIWEFIEKVRPGWNEEECGGPYPFEIEEGQSTV